jgi:hypothetical protein
MTFYVRGQHPNMTSNEHHKTVQQTEYKYNRKARHSYMLLSCYFKHFNITFIGPPLWSSGQSSWIQIQRHGFDSWRYQIFWQGVGLERGPLSLMSITEELLGRNIYGCSLECWERRRSIVMTTWHPLSTKVWTNFANKWWSLGRHRSLAD